jgi:hypothetical protein
VGFVMGMSDGGVLIKNCSLWGNPTRRPVSARAGYHAVINRRFDITNAIQASRFVGFKRVAGFGEAHAADMLPVAPAKKATKAQLLFGELGTTADIVDSAAPGSVVGILGQAANVQQAGAGGYHGGTATRGGLREKLKSALRRVRKGALATTALGFAAAAEPLRAAFVELRFKADFIETLRAEVKAFENARDDQDAGLREQAGAGADIEAQLARGTAIVAQLDVMMRNHYEGQPRMLAEWSSAIRRERPVRGRARALASGAVKAVPVPKPALTLLVAPEVAAELTPGAAFAVVSPTKPVKAGASE